MRLSGPLPFRVAGERACGPGIDDLKGGNAIAVAALKHLHATGRKPHMPVSAMMIPVEIRQMRPAEIGRVVEILAHWNMAPVAPGPGCPDPETSGLEEGRTFVAVSGGTVVGVASYVLRGDGWAETASLAVDPAWRGKGVGERLQRARLAAMKTLGVQHVRTETDRPETIAWYQRKFGYRVAGAVPKKHAFSLPDVAGHTWNLPELRGKVVLIFFWATW